MIRDSFADSFVNSFGVKKELFKEKDLLIGRLKEVKRVMNK